MDLSDALAPAALTVALLACAGWMFAVIRTTCHE
jgi:hypothetical protein